jgi:hypothetical protein
MMRTGVTAAALVVAAIVLVAGGKAAPTQGAAAHTCSATDKQFINAAQLNISSVGLFGESYLHGEAKANEVVGAARDASDALAATDPRDGSLSSARQLMRAMFLEYGRAVQMHAKGGKPGLSAGRHMYRAYSLANFAHEVLTQAEPGLARHGCDVTDLL